VADSEKTFPDPGAKPGKYALEWLVGKSRWLTGDVELAPRRRPRIELNGKLRRPRKNAAGELVYAFPGEEINFPRLVGRLRSNEEIVVIDATLSQWFLERFLGFGRWAIVGLDIAGVPDGPIRPSELPDQRCRFVVRYSTAGEDELART